MRCARAVALSLGIQVDQATELIGGNQNHVVRVRGGGRDVVVRFAKDENRAVVDPFDVEAWCLGAAATAGIRTSTLVARGLHEGLSYLVVDYIPGATAAADDLDAWREIGRITTALAGVDVAAAPDALFSRFGRDLVAAWDAHLAYNLAALDDGDPICAAGVYHAEDRDALRETLSRLAHRGLHQGVVHGDLSTRNLLAKDGYAVIDWGSAHTGPAGWGDLDQINRWRLLGDPDVPVSETAWAAVLDGAGLDEAIAQAVLDELAVLHALDVVRWAREKRPDRLADLTRQSTGILRALTLTS